MIKTQKRRNSGQIVKNKKKVDSGKIFGKKQLGGANPYKDIESYGVTDVGDGRIMPAKNFGNGSISDYESDMIAGLDFRDLEGRIAKNNFSGGKVRKGKGEFSQTSYGKGGIFGVVKNDKVIVKRNGVPGVKTELYNKTLSRFKDIIGNN